jgi:hypothetical protein
MVLGDSDHARERYVSMSLVAASLELDSELAELQRAAASCPMPDLSGSPAGR